MLYFKISCAIDVVLVVVLCVMIADLRTNSKYVNIVQANLKSLVSAVEGLSKAVEVMEEDFDLFKNKQSERDIQTHNNLIRRMRNVEKVTADTALYVKEKLQGEEDKDIE